MARALSLQIIFSLLFLETLSITAGYAAREPQLTWSFLCVKGEEGCCCGEANCFCPMPSTGVISPPLEHQSYFQITMQQGYSRHSCGWCCFGFWCTPCAACVVRRRALDGNIGNYRCCQGYFQPVLTRVCAFTSSQCFTGVLCYTERCCCCPAPGGCCEESCPSCCLCLESWFCHPCSMSATRMLLMDKFRLVSEPSDYQIFRTNNTTFTTDLVVSVVLGGFSSISYIPNIVNAIATIVYYCTVGCMTDQMIHEMQYQARNKNDGPQPPPYVTMTGRNIGPNPPPTYGNMTGRKV